MNTLFSLSPMTMPFYRAYKAKQGSFFVVSSTFDLPILVKISSTASQDYIVYPSIFVLAPRTAQEICVSLTLKEELKPHEDHRYSVDAFPLEQGAYASLSTDPSLQPTALRVYWNTHYSDACRKGRLFTQKFTIPFVDGAPPTTVQKLARNVPAEILDSKDLDTELGNISHKKARYIAEKASLLHAIQLQQGKIDLLKNTISRDEAEILRFNKEIDGIQKRLKELSNHDAFSKYIIGTRLELRVVHYILAIFIGLICGRLLRKF